ncbi:hypothetical protein LIA77_04280 [Sarocladium implicatum]|nr:hypothetical protein LIA77_04280 [Sarocladium implicatum]
MAATEAFDMYEAMSAIRRRAQITERFRDDSQMRKKAQVLSYQGRQQTCLDTEAHHMESSRAARKVKLSGFGEESSVVAGGTMKLSHVEQITIAGRESYLVTALWLLIEMRFL